ncbi:MAG: hypothetical protein ABUS51_01200 [Acidobacteriota bacterium]
MHAEGLTEPVGDIILVCTGGTGGSTATLFLYATLNVNITNRLDANGNPTGISVTVTGGGAGPVSTGTQQVSATTFTAASVSYPVPAVPSSPVTITIKGIRAAAAMLSGTGGGTLLSASVVVVGATTLAPPSLPIGIASPTLQASTLNNGVPCVGSPLPTTLDFPTFAITSLSSAVRVTEASVNAFTPKDPTSDTGLRILVNLSGYTTGSRVFVPDAITGNDSGAPTSAGEFNSTINGGTYTGSGQLLLVRVTGADATGAGGATAFGLPAAGTSFTSVSEISLTNGKGYVVYEVVDSNPGLIESAQVPLFLVVPSSVCTGITPLPTVSPVAAPVSTVMVATATDPIPRFVSTAPGSDCLQFNDCTASYFPALSVDMTPINFSAASLGNRQSGLIAVVNSGGGLLNFTSSVTYDANGANWLTVTPAIGQSSSANNANLQLVADPGMLQPGTYTATVTIDASPFGTASVPVVFTVGPVGVTIQNVGNAASFQFGTVAPGSYAALFGRNLAGTNVGVTFNGFPANVVFANATQINLIVPSGVASRAAADVVVTVDGKASNTFKVGIDPNTPGIFSNGIVNFVGGAGNTAANPVMRGDFVVVYLTGLATPVVGLTVNIGSQTNLVPSFAGPQGTFPALDQVNIAVPLALPASPNPVPFTVCVPDPPGAQACSNPVNLYIK